MSANYETITVEVDAKLKDEVLKICSEMGMDLDTLINLFLREVVRTKTLPFIPTAMPPEPRSAQASYDVPETPPDIVVVYPVIITKTPEAEQPYLVEIPAVNGIAYSSTLAGVLAAATEFIGIYSLDHEMPPSATLADLPATENGAVTSFVRVNVSAYRRAHHVAEVPVIIPADLSALAEERGLNLSHVLTDTLKNQLDGEQHS